jgi:hypothetical protein
MGFYMRCLRKVRALREARLEGLSVPPESGQLNNKPHHADLRVNRLTQRGFL